MAKPYSSPFRSTTAASSLGNSPYECALNTPTEAPILILFPNELPPPLPSLAVEDKVVKDNVSFQKKKKMLKEAQEPKDIIGAFPILGAQGQAPWHNHLPLHVFKEFHRSIHDNGLSSNFTKEIPSFFVSQRNQANGDCYVIYRQLMLL